MYEDLPSDVISDHVVPIPEKSHRVAPGLLPLDHHRLLVRTASSSGIHKGLMFSPRPRGTIAGVSQIVKDDLLHLVVTAVVQPRYVINHWFKLGVHCFLQVLAPEVHAGPRHHYHLPVSFGAGRSLLLGESLDSLSLTEILTICSL